MVALHPSSHGVPERRWVRICSRHFETWGRKVISMTTLGNVPRSISSPDWKQRELLSLSTKMTLGNAGGDSPPLNRAGRRSGSIPSVTRSRTPRTSNPIGRSRKCGQNFGGSSFRRLRQGSENCVGRSARSPDVGAQQPRRPIDVDGRAHGERDRWTDCRFLL